MIDFDLLDQKEREFNSAETVSAKKDPEVDLSERLYDIYKSPHDTWAEEAKDDDNFRNGAQWTEKARKALVAAGHAPIVVNMVGPKVESAVGLLTHNNPSFTATAKEDSDSRIAKIFADLMSYIWKQSNGNQELKIAVDDYYVRGMGALLVYFDPLSDFGKGEVCIQNIDPFDVYIDPNAKDRLARDAAHILIVKRMTLEQLQVAFPDAREWLAQAKEEDASNHPSGTTQGLEGQTDHNDYNDGHHKKYRITERYSRIKVGKYHVYEPSTQFEKVLNADEYESFLQEPAVAVTTPEGTQFVVDPVEVKAYMDLYEKTGGEIDENVTVNLFTMQELAENGVILVNEILVNRIRRIISVGGYKVYSGIMPIEDYPIIPLMNRHNRNPFPLGDVRSVRGIQEYINKVRSLIIAHASSSTNVKLLLPRGAASRSDIEQQWARPGTGVIEYDPEIGVPIVAGPVPLPNELYKNEAEAKKDIEEILGIYALMAGDPNQSHESFRGTVALDEYGQRRIKSKRDDIESALNQLAKVTVQLIQAYYNEPKVIRIVEPNHLPRESKINYPIYDNLGGLTGKINDITVGKYDLIVVSGSMLPSNRWAVLEHYKELYQMGIIDQVEVLKKTEVADVEGVLERHGIITQLQQQVQAMEEAIKNFEGDTQTKDREISHMQKKVELEKFKTKLAETGSDLTKAQQMFEARLNDQLGLQKKEAQLAQKEAQVAKSRTD